MILIATITYRSYSALEAFREFKTTTYSANNYLKRTPMSISEEDTVIVYFKEVEDIPLEKCNASHATLRTVCAVQKHME